MQTLKEFRSSFIKSRGLKRGGIGYSRDDYYRYYRKNRTIDYKIEVKQYQAILDRANQELVNLLLRYSIVRLPLGLGELVLKSYKPTLEYNDKGTLINKIPIDWNETIRLWFNDPEAHRDKTIIRLNTDKQFSLKYLKHKAIYKNRRFYLFAFNRSLKKKVVKLAKENKLQTFDNNNDIWLNKQ